VTRRPLVARAFSTFRVPEDRERTGVALDAILQAEQNA
jgi:hypothetical protein